MCIRDSFLTCYYINYVFARGGRALFQIRFFQVPTLMPFPTKVHKLLLQRGNIHPTLFRNSLPKFDIEANQPFQEDNIIIPPPCVAAPKSDRGRVSTSEFFGKTAGTLVNLRVLVLYWNHGCCTLRPFGGGVLVFDTQATVIPHKSGRSCQYWSIQFCSSSANVITTHTKKALTKVGLG